MSDVTRKKSVAYLWFGTKPKSGRRRWFQLLVGCNCSPFCSLKSECCPSGMDSPFAYRAGGKLRVEFAGKPIFECNHTCLCNRSCLNRTVQRRRQIPVNFLIYLLPYLHTCLLIYSLLYLLTSLLTSLLNYLLSYLLPYLLIYVLTYFHAYLLTHLITSLLTYSLTSFLNYLRLTYLLPYLRTHLLTYFPTYYLLTHVFPDSLNYFLTYLLLYLLTYFFMTLLPPLLT